MYITTGFRHDVSSSLL